MPYVAETETLVNTTAAGEQTSSSATVLKDGSYVVVWTSAGAVMAQHFAADGKKIGSEFTVIAPARLTGSPVVTATDDGGYVVTWQTFGEAVNSIINLTRQFGADDAPKTESGIQIGSLSKVGAQVSVTSFGSQIFYSWDVGENTTRSIKGRFYDTKTGLFGAELTLAPAGGYGKSMPAVTALKDGTFVLTYSSAMEDGSGLGIYALRFRSDGTPVTTGNPASQSVTGGFRVNTTVTNNQRNPSIAALEDGGFVIVWMSGAAIMAQRYGADGNAVGGEVNIATIGNTLMPLMMKVVALKEGGFFVVWHELGKDANGAAVMGQFVDAGGRLSGASFVVNKLTAGDQYLASATQKGFDILLTWSDSTQDGDGLGVMKQVIRKQADLTDQDETITGTSSDETFVTDPGGVSAGDSINGGGGTDTIVLAAAGTMDVTLPRVFSGIERLAGSPGNDVFIVSAERLEGLQKIDGAGGNDILRMKNTGTLDLSMMELVSIEKIEGTAGNDTIVGSAGRDIIDGGAGEDGMTGGAGDDTYYVDNASDSVTEREAGGNDDIVASVSYTLLAHIERLTLSGSGDLTARGNELDNVLVGNDGKNTLTGGLGNDDLDGGKGADLMVGGQGFDRYHVDDAKDIVDEAADNGGGRDTVVSTISFSLSGPAVRGEVENLTLAGEDDLDGIGNAIRNFITGNNGENELRGLAGNDQLDGGDRGRARDILVGGAGDDFYIVYGEEDIIDERADGGEGRDSVSASCSFDFESDNIRGDVEDLFLTGAGDFIGAGNRLANDIYGNEGNNILMGRDGDDLLDGGLGNDVLIGGTGNDTYFVSDQNDVVDERDGNGIDTVESFISYSLNARSNANILGAVENLILSRSASNIDGTGNELANQITGNAASNTLTGLGGDDRLDGGGGDDRLVGGVGNDTYIVDSVGDVVSEANGLGRDLVLSSVSFSLSDATRAIGAIENLTLTGTAANGTGNALDNVLIGNDLQNVLTGLSGNDILNGGKGADVLLGGKGSDIYYVDNMADLVDETGGRKGETDTVYSSVSFDFSDPMQAAGAVENLVLTGTAVSGTGNGLDNVLTGNGTNNILSGGAGNDLLIGGLGSDTLTGGSGADTFRFDTMPNARTNLDTITDFRSGEDTVLLENAIFTSLRATGKLGKTFFAVGTDGLAKDRDDFLIYNSKTGALMYDADANGKGAAMQIAWLGKNLQVSSTDFTVI